jgi:hypothetical protein
MWLFIAALFIIKNWTQQQNINAHKQTVEWINNCDIYVCVCVYIYIYIYIYIQKGILSSHKNEWSSISLHAAKWIDLKNIVLSERSQHKRQHVVWFHLYEISRIDKTHRNRKNCQGLGKGIESNCSKGSGFHLSEKKYFGIK